MQTEDLKALKRAVDYLETATRLIEEDGGDEDDVEDARECIAKAREALKRLGL